VPDPGQIRVCLDQLVPIKQAVRTLPTLVNRLNAGEGPFVLTKQGKPLAVLTALDSLQEGAEGG
jgi:antitoxin (DNA-binding transcriptional repressor) of toxin-antitoxin stability system